jgi:hypothetical protein
MRRCVHRGSAIRRFISRCLLAVAVLALPAGTALAAEPGAAPGGPPENARRLPPVAPPEYHPSFGDLMTMAVQPRHTKLGLAGRAGNWPYATYELSELRNAFARIARTIPLYNRADTASLIAAMTTAPLAAVADAIHAQDRARFVAAYRDLTSACNRCHQSQRHGFVVIRVPQENPYPDQQFRAGGASGRGK